MDDAEPRRASRWLDRDFRWRGSDVSRMEALADAVFALVLALLFLQSKPPGDFEELAAALKALVPFAITFALLAMVWGEHHRYFRRYGLSDKATFYGNLVLLALVLFLAYPLKFLFTFLCVAMFGPIGELSGTSMTRGMQELGTTNLMVVYSAGYGAIYGVFTLLYRHALARADELGLDAVERHMTKTSMLACLVLVGFALLSITFACAGAVPLSGLVYFGIGPTMAALGFRRGSAQRRLVLARASRSPEQRASDQSASNR